MKVLAPHEGDPIWLLLGKALVGVALVAGAPFLVKPAFKNFNQARASASWPQTEAEITHSEITQERRGKKTSWKPLVSFSYTVDGKPYTSSKIAFRGFGTPIYSHAEEMVIKYPVGSKHQAYYSPEDHSIAVLETGSNWLVTLALFVPVLFLLMGGYVAYENFAYLYSQFDQPKKKKQKKKRAQTSTTSSPNSALKRRRRRIRKNQDGG